MHARWKVSDRRNGRRALAVLGFGAVVGQFVGDDPVDLCRFYQLRRIWTPRQPIGGTAVGNASERPYCTHDHSPLTLETIETALSDKKLR